MKGNYFDLYSQQQKSHAIIYQANSDSDYHFFFKLEPHLLHIPHFHESIELICIKKGSTIAHIGSQTKTLSEGDICITNPNIPHYYTNSSMEIQAFVLVLGKNYVLQLLQRYSDSQLKPFMTTTIKNEPIISMIEQWFEEPNKHYLLNCSYVNKLFFYIKNNYGFEKSKKENKTHINNYTIIEYIRNNIANNITLKSMATYFGYTKEYFSKIFNESIGIHFNDYLSITRLQYTLSQIQKNPSKKHSEIILSCGYNNLVTFYRQYKKHIKLEEIPTDQ